MTAKKSQVIEYPILLLSFYPFSSIKQVIGKMMGLLDQVSITNSIELSAVVGALGSMTKDADDLTDESQVSLPERFKVTKLP